MAEKKGSKKYEIASAYVSVIPSLKDMSSQLEKQVQAATPSIRKGLDAAIGRSLSGVSINPSSLTSKVGSALAGAGRFMTSGLHSAVVSAGRAWRETLTAGSKAAGLALTGSVGAATAAVAGGGLKRALSLNESEAKLSALGYSAQQLQSIMDTASKSIDGTAYSMSESVNAAANFLSAGVEQGDDLQNVLSSTAKLADISGRSFGEMAHLMTKNASAGVVQWEDLVQIIDSGVPILDALQKSTGKTGAEIKKMASESKLSFDDLNNAINGINFDSALYASLNLKQAYANVKAQAAKIGGDIWRPITEGMGPMLVEVRQGLKDLQSNPAWRNAVNLIQTTLASGMDRIGGVVHRFTSSLSSVDKVGSTITRVVAKLREFRESLSGLQGPAAGVGLALGSGLLSQIPVIGSLFGGVTLRAGLLGGSMIQMVSSSDLLQNSFKSLGTSFSNLLSKITSNLGGTNLFETIGDKMSKAVDSISQVISNIDPSKIKGFNLSGFIESIFGNATDFITEIISKGDQIGDAIGRVVNAVSNALSGVSGGLSGVSLGTWLADTVVSGIDTAANTLAAVAPLLINVAGLLATVITSDFTQGVLGWIGDVAQWFAEHQGATIALATTLGVLFVGGKLTKPIMAMIRFFKGVGSSTEGGDKQTKSIEKFIDGVTNVISKVITGLGSVASQAVTTVIDVAVTGVTSLVNGLATIGKVASKAAPEALIGLAAVSVLIIAAAAVMKAVTALGINESIQQFSDTLAYVTQNVISTIQFGFVSIASGVSQAAVLLSGGLSAVFKVVQPIISFLTTTFLVAFTTVLSTVTESVTAIASTVASGAALVIDSSVLLLSTFSSTGVSAGAGALAAAAGILAFSASIGALSLAMIGLAVANVGATLVNSVAGDDSVLAQIVSIGNSLAVVTSSIRQMPSQWVQISGEAYSAGTQIMSSFSSAMVSGVSTAKTQVLSEVRSLLDSVQSQVNSRTFTLKFQAPGSLAVAGNGGSSVYNQNSTYNISTSNQSVTNEILRRAR